MSIWAGVMVLNVIVMSTAMHPVSLFGELTFVRTAKIVRRAGIEVAQSTGTPTSVQMTREARPMGSNNSGNARLLRLTPTQSVALLAAWKNPCRIQLVLPQTPRICCRAFMMNCASSLAG